MAIRLVARARGPALPRWGITAIISKWTIVSSSPAFAASLLVSPLQASMEVAPAKGALAPVDPQAEDRRSQRDRG